MLSPPTRTTPELNRRSFGPIVWGLLRGILCRQWLSEVEVDEAR